MTERIKFGIFMAPFHRAGENPTLSSRRPRTPRILDRLVRRGLDRRTPQRRREISPPPPCSSPPRRSARSASCSAPASPAFPTTTLFMVADRMVHVRSPHPRPRHARRWALALCTSDAYMMGIDATTQRPRIGGVTGSNHAAAAPRRGRERRGPTGFSLREARLQLANFSGPHLPVAVGGVLLSGRARLLPARHGIGLLSRWRRTSPAASTP